MQPETSTEAAPDMRHRKLATVIVVLATVIGIASIMALWVKRQALETETWTETSSELLEDEAIRDAVADFIVEAIFANVDVQATLEQRLPPQLDPLAGPAAGGLRELATRGAQEALARPKVQGLWEDANEAAHERLLALLEDEGEFVATTSGVVTLDLSQLVSEIADSVGVGGGLVAKLPEGASSIEILRSDELEAAQTGVDLLRTAAYVLAALTLLLYALAIYLARGRRRETLRMVGFSFLAIGIVVLFVRSAAGDALTTSLTATAAAEAPVLATWEIGTSLLQEMGQSLVVYGLVIVLAAWLAGPTATATGIRNAIAPYLRQPRIAYGALAALLVLLFWWDPVIATHRIVPSIIVIVLLAIGVEALRRQVIREFPDRVTARSPAGAASAMAGRMAAGREARISRRAAGPEPAASPTDQRLEQLERLARLREAGLLEEDELARETARIMGRTTE
jgi:hypothetical protein